MTKYVLLLAVCLIGACQSTQPRITFDEAHKRAKAQPTDVAYAYEEKWDAFNNTNHIDEKGGCYEKSSGSTQQVLVIDKSGIVTDVIADVDNAKSICFRESYLHVQFPAPPFAPYYMYLHMQ